MLSFGLCMSLSILLLVPSTSALYLADAPASINSLPASPPTNELKLVNVSSTTNVSAATSLNSFGVGDFSDPVCDGNRLGFDMNRYSCSQAWYTIPTSDSVISFGNRSEKNIDVWVPRRFSSRKCFVFFAADHYIRSSYPFSRSQPLQTDSSWISKADGTCVIDIFHRDGLVSDTASFLEISRAAKRLDTACVAKSDHRVQGGWIRHIGTCV